ncbi:hypothetical protein LZ30DRAFT_387363 [Colletotrichum cereale]|nr:hypothetical protein LZ30DRAFT_387363 [Colletotrichum cereale]
MSPRRWHNSLRCTPSSPDSYPVGRELGLGPREPAFIDKRQIWGNSAARQELAGHSTSTANPPYLMLSSHEHQLRQSPARIPLLIRLDPTPGSSCQSVAGMPIEGRVVAWSLPGMEWTRRSAYSRSPISLSYAIPPKSVVQDAACALSPELAVGSQARRHPVFLPTVSQHTRQLVRADTAPRSDLLSSQRNEVGTVTE